MLRFLGKRVAHMVPVLLLISLLVFLVTYLLPGDPALVILGQTASPDSLAAVRHDLGLDKPLIPRYLTWLNRVIQGDLGRSFITRQPVTKLIADALPVSLELALFALAIALIIAVPLGVLSAIKKDSWIDLVAGIVAFAGVATPSFWLGIMLIYLFAVTLNWLPSTGYQPVANGLTANVKSLVLPATTLGFFLAAPLMRYLRAGVLSVLQEDYVLLARMKGISPTRLLLRHVVRNALIPFITVLGMQLASLIGGMVVIEQVFALPGMGRLAVQALFDRDYTALQGVAMIVAGGFVMINLIVDLLYSLLDPRIRLDGGEAG